MPPSAEPESATERDGTQAGGVRILRREPLADGPADGRLAVLVHGTMDRATSFTRLMARLRDWTIVTYDRRGYGKSSHLGPPKSFDDQVADLLAVLDGQPAVAFGHSFGGDVVLATMSRHPGLITSAVVWEPPQPWQPYWPSLSRRTGDDVDPGDQAERFMRRMVGDHIWERLPRATKAQRRAEGVTLSAELAGFDLAPAFDPALVRAPVTVGRGGRSHPYQRRGARELAAALPHGELVEVADAGHGVHLSHPSEVAALIRRRAELA